MYNNFFSDLYFGNYKPVENKMDITETKMLEDKMNEIHKKLTHTLDNNNLELFLQFDEIRDDLNDFYEVRAFSQGIKFMLDLVGNLPLTSDDTDNVRKFIQDLHRNLESPNVSN